MRSPASSSRAVSATLLGLASLAFGAWAITAPRHFASTMGVSPRWARPTGLRDLAIGALILTRGDRTAFALRALADAWDAATVSKTPVRRGAAVVAGLALSAARQAR